MFKLRPNDNRKCEMWKSPKTEKSEECKQMKNRLHFILN